MTQEQIEQAAQEYLLEFGGLGNEKDMSISEAPFIVGEESRQFEIEELVEALETAFSLLSLSNHTPHGTRKFMNEVTELLKKYDV